MDNLTLNDKFGRAINYLRLSVTDRCDFRCVYCMAEDMTFLPRKEILSIEELCAVGSSFADLGASKIRITGGEPLIRGNIIALFKVLGAHRNITDLCVTTNGSRLSEFAVPLADAGVTSLNVSLDSLDAERFHKITRHGKLAQVLLGLKAAKKAGIKRIKINCVVLKSRNSDEVEQLAHYALNEGYDISFIEEMPLGEISSHQRDEEFVSSQSIRETLSSTLSLSSSDLDTGGPSRYWKAKGYNNKIGFISPHSDNFCSTCNRVRVTASGKLLLCLGNEHAVDLRDVLRSNNTNTEQLKNTIISAMAIKPEKHDFDLAAPVEIVRFMNTTGG